MKVGTDAMVLGASIIVKGKSKALEVGTGTGVISLMLAQQNSDIELLAVEIDSLSAEEADANFKSSPWSNRMAVNQIDFLEYSTSEKFDLIFSNPPYYTSTNLNEDARMAKAKHESSLPILPFLKKVSDLMMPNADFWIIIPKSDQEKWVKAGDSVNLQMRSKIDISGKPSTIPNRVILQFNRGAITPLVTSHLTIRRENGHYSDDYIALTKEFHHKDLSRI